MGPWLFILILVLGITFFILLVTLLSSVMIAHAARKHSQKTMDANIKILEKMLPGENCGVCGCETCREYAKEVFICNMDADKCVCGSEDLPQRMSAQVEKFLKEMEDNAPQRTEEKIW